MYLFFELFVDLSLLIHLRIIIRDIFILTVFDMVQVPICIAALFTCMNSCMYSYFETSYVYWQDSKKSANKTREFISEPLESPKNIFFIHLHLMKTLQNPAVFSNTWVAPTASVDYLHSPVSSRDVLSPGAPGQRIELGFRGYPGVGGFFGLFMPFLVKVYLNLALSYPKR